ncbi:membrane protein, partial [Raoultella planticola]
IGLGTASSDTWITTKVRSQLLGTDQVKSSNVKVTTENGEVFLMGLVTEREGRAAADIASRVSGVSRVIGLGTASSDTWITTKVRSQLLGTDQVKSSNVKVTTENGEVFLMGLVTEREGRAAADIASRVSGVSRVTTAFTYIK